MSTQVQQLLTHVLRDPTLLSTFDYENLPDASFGKFVPLWQKIKELRAIGRVPSRTIVSGMYQTEGWPKGINDATFDKWFDNIDHTVEPIDLYPIILDTYRKDALAQKFLEASTRITRGESAETILADLDSTIKEVTTLEVKTKENPFDLALKERSSAITGVPVIFEGLQEILPMFRNGKLYVVAARAKTGKSSWISVVVDNILKFSTKKVLLISLEEGQIAAADRLLIQQTKINNAKWGTKSDIGLPTLSSGDLGELGKAVEYYKSKPLVIADESNIFTIVELVRKHKPDILFLDQLSHISGLSDGDYDRRSYKYEEFLKILRHRIAKEFNIPVVLAVQIRRQLDGSKEPTAAETKDSGAIEEYCDCMVMLHRWADKKELLIKVELNRQGPTGKYYYNFEGSTYIYTLTTVPDTTK